jgi:hypothetical protein
MLMRSASGLATTHIRTCHYHPVGSGLGLGVLELERLPSFSNPTKIARPFWTATLYGAHLNCNTRGVRDNLPREEGTRAAIGRFEVFIVIGVIVVAAIGIVGYYSPITNPPTYSYTFRTSINYSGGWQEIDYMYHSVGKPPARTANYTGGSSLGAGPSTGTITLSAQGNQGLTLCIVVGKLDSSNATLVVGIDGMTNETSLPYGHASVCEGVVP